MHIYISKTITSICSLVLSFVKNSIAIFYEILVRIQYGTYSSILYVINYYCPLWIPPVIKCEMCIRDRWIADLVCARYSLDRDLSRNSRNKMRAHITFRIGRYRSAPLVTKGYFLISLIFSQSHCQVNIPNNIPSVVQ